MCRQGLEDGLTDPPYGIGNELESSSFIESFRSLDKTQILELYLSGYQFSQIQKRTHHSETAVKRYYIQDFSKIILLHLKGFCIDEIRISTGFSNRLIKEYIQLYERFKKEDNPKLLAIMNGAKKNQAGTVS